MDLNEFIIRHDGVITRRQAIGLGLSADAIKRRVATGTWVQVSRGVYLAANYCRGPRAQARLAVGSVGPAAVLGGVAAAWWLGLLADEPRRHLVFTARRGRHAQRTSTIVVAHRAIRDEDVWNHHLLPVTAPALTALDAALDVGIAILDTALLRRFTTIEALRSAHTRYPRRHGAARIAGYLSLLDNGARSEGERIVVKVFRRAGITGWVANYPSAGYQIDFAFPDEMVAVEIDGYAYHRNVAAFQNDRTRRNALVAAGWTVLNFTWADLVDHPAALIAAVRRALAAAA